ncbi:hypothetical protein IFM89_014332 [Coptis chinensis]|uniref:Uncharacterized protein n=1 Tax=Coptis chinensis TaxID=261450 RepID=A0A835HTT2_9MAGN|nr:hypothetical protein IFM89_014332 [Coptis chinensis]
MVKKQPRGSNGDENGGKWVRGTSTLPKIREEGAPPSQGDFFVLSHTSRKTNDALDGQSREYIEKMKELAGRDENGNQQPLSDEIYRQVMRVRSTLCNE